MRRLLLVTPLLCLATTAFARPTFPTEVPNGSVYNCLTCHTQAAGGPSWNDFGLDVRANLSGGFPDWAAVYDMDSDGDGQTNGEELGDPCGDWTGGAAPRTTDISAPGNSDDTSADPSTPDCGPTDTGDDTTDTTDTTGGTDTTDTGDDYTTPTDGGTDGGTDGDGSGLFNCSTGAGSAGLLGLLPLLLIARRRR